jgi:23S rRNA (guanosine2251-2'-O)-methyltransferase
MAPPANRRATVRATPRRVAMSIVHGFHPVREALRRRPHRVRRVLIARRESGSRAREIADLCARHGVTVENVEWAVLRKVAPEAKQGIVAEMVEAAVGDAEVGDALESPARETSRERAADVVRDREMVVLLEDIQDPRNLGALLRVCEGAGVGRVLIRDRGAAPLTATVVAASAGATEWLEVERVTNTVAELERLKEAGFWVYGAAEGGEPPWAIDLTGPTVLCFGGEEKGLRRLTREKCDRMVGLPMRGRVESLNVATAAAALLYEAVRQRTKQ